MTPTAGAGPGVRISDRVASIDASGIRRVLERGRLIPDAINLSIGQPDFAVPEAIKRGAVRAIESDLNGYSLTGGVEPLLERIVSWLGTDLGWSCASVGGTGETSVLVTSGTSGALLMAFLCLLNPGDEAIMPDPYFVVYPHLATLCDARAVLCDTWPDFRMTAERVEPLITDRTRLVLVNSPSNPVGTVLTRRECGDLLDLCRSRGVMLISDEIYDEFTFAEHLTDAACGDAGRARPPSPCRLPGSEGHTLLIRGFGKTYGCTGWRLGYAAGPRELMLAMARLQQYTFVCPPTPLQHGVVASFDVDMTAHVETFRRRRDLVASVLGRVTEVVVPGGAFYAWVEVPERLGVDATGFVEWGLSRRVMVIPGGVFGRRDRHVRLSFACPDAKLEEGLAILAGLFEHGSGPA